MALPVIAGAGNHFTLNGAPHTLRTYRMIVRGTGIGFANGNDVIANPIPGHNWGFANFQAAVDGVASILYTGI